jgi:nucleoside-diphosphate-sugar epimerase
VQLSAAATAYLPPRWEPKMTDSSRSETRTAPERPLVLITGSTGMIGSRLAEALERRFDVVGLDLHCAGANHGCIETDLTTDEGLSASLDEAAERHGERIASVIHLAAYYDLSGEPHPLYDRLNVEGTRRPLRALRKKFEVDQFLYASTMLVHRPTGPGIPITEDSPLEAKWAYPKSKIAAEEAVRAEHGDIPAVLLRIAGLYTDDCGSPFLAHQIERIYERRLTGNLYAGDTARGQAFLHIDDLVELVDRLIERRAELPAELPLLAGEPEVMTYEALQNRLGELLHGEADWHTREVPPSLAAAGAWLQEKTEPLVPDAIDRGEPPFVRPYMAAMSEDHYEIDAARARELLDWTPRHRLRDALPAMVRALKADPPGWYARHKLTPPPWFETAREEDIDPAKFFATYNETGRDEHYRTQWAHFINIGLGAWLATSPAISGYVDRAMTASDIASGLLILLFAGLSLSWRMGWARIGTAAVGLWLMVAPLLFWAPSAAGYLTDTLIGSLVFCLAVVVAPPSGHFADGQADRTRYSTRLGIQSIGLDAETPDHRPCLCRALYLTLPRRVPARSYSPGMGSLFR